VGTRDGAARPPIAARVAVALAAWLAATAPGGAGAQELTVWDVYTPEAQNATFTAINEAFEKANPGVKIVRTVKTLADTQLTLKLAVSGGNGPMVAGINQGAGDMGAMVKEHDLVPLDAYAQQYGWDKNFSSTLLDRNRWTDGGAFGTGKLYGAAGLGELVGLYYDKAVLDKAGVAVPTTFDDFKAALATLKAKGVVPLMIGTQDGYAALHLFATLQQIGIDAADRAPFDSLIYGRGGTWNTQAAVDAAATLQDWARKGYFFPGYQGIAGDDTVPLFVGDQAAFLVTGTWNLAGLAANPAIHFTPLPGKAGVKAPLIVGGSDIPFGITAMAKDKATQDAAAKYMDFLLSDQVAAMWAENGSLPARALAHPDQLKISPLLKEALAMWKDANAKNALGHYPDWATPTMLKTLTENLQLLMADRQSPQEFIGKLDADYKAYVASQAKP
jgi:raffinose/stachyose/melibiose transport system substrate-binding protein